MGVVANRGTSLQGLCLGIGLAVGMVLGLSVAYGQEASGIRVVSAESRLVDDVYHLDARIDFRLTAAASEALDSGVPLTVDLKIEVLRERPYLWDPTVFSLSQRFRLEYHVLSDLYLLRNLNTGTQRSFVSRRAALDVLGQVDDFPMLDRSLLTAGEHYYARLRGRLDAESLPLPLRPLPYFFSEWRMASDWYTWRVNR